MNTITSTNISQLWIEAVRNVISSENYTNSCSDILSIGSYFGQKKRSTIEELAATLVLTNPRNRILISQNKKINYSYLFANFMFMLCNEKTLRFIDFYNKKGRLFSDDGHTLNAPLGYRILNYNNQIEQIKKTLKNDSSSRRALIQIFDRKDIFKKTKDYPCLNYFQFFIRNNKLHMITNMRSQSAYNLLPYDIFIFTMFQELVSVYLGVGLGKYIHFSGSLHIYDDEIDNAINAIENDNEYIGMKPMTSFSMNILDELFKIESDIRSKILLNKADSINYNNYNIDDYWISFMKTMFNFYINPNSLNALQYVSSSQLPQNTLISKGTFF